MSDRIGSASIGLAVDSSGVDAGLNTMEATVTRTARSLSSLGRQGAQAVDGIAAGATNAASQTERATRRIQNEIQRTTAVAQAGERGTRAYYEAIANQRGANLNALRPYLDQLEQVRAAQQAATAGALRSGQAFNTQAQSAAQLAANLRGVPAQLTDIVTSLQGGQPALTVFLQQGGQLRDMFGSIGGAARALGGYLVSLISPLTVGAAAIAALAVAYNQGSKEADAFRLAIIKSGNAAGVTTSQLQEMAKQAAAVAGTQGANAEAITALVATGRVAADQLVRFSTVAVQSQKLLGTSIEDTAKAFSDLGKDPVQASKKLDEQTNFLTLTLYRQIKALADQGRTADAARLAQNAYAESQERNTKTVQDNLGSLEKSWNAVAGAAKFAWDKMLDVGREDTLDDKIKKAQENLKKANDAYRSFIGTTSEKDADRAEAQRQLDRLLNIKKVGELQAQNDADEKKRKEAAMQFDQDSEKSQSRRLQMEKEIAQARALGQQSAARGEDPATTEERIQKRIAQIRGNYADLLNQGIEGKIANIERLGEAQEAAARRSLLALQGDQDAGFTRAADKKLAVMEAIAKADIASIQREKEILKQRLALTAQETVSEDGRAAQQQKLADLRGKIAIKDIEIGARRDQLNRDSVEEDVRLNREAFASLDALLDAREADTQALRQQLEAQNDQNAALGLSGQALADFNTKLVEERAVRLELKADILETIAGREEEAEQLRRQAQLMRDLNKAQIEGANKSKAIEANKSFWASVDKTAQSAFTAIFEGGKSAFDRLRDALKAGLLDMLYQLTVKKWIINIAASTEGSGIAGQIASVVGGSGSTGGGSSAFATASNLFSIGKTIYQGFSTGIASSLGSSIASLGNLFGSQAVSAFGTGLSLTTSQAASAAAAYGGTGTAVGGGLTAGASAGAYAIPIAGWIAAGMTLAKGLYSQGWDATNGSLNTGGKVFGSAILGFNSILKGIGLSDSAANIFSGQSTIAKLFGRKNPEIESQGIQGSISAAGVTGESFLNILEKGGWFRSDKRTSTTAALTPEVDTSFDNTILAMIASVKGFGKAIGVETGNIDNYTKDFKLALTGDAVKDKELVTKLFSDTGDELSNLLVPNLAKLTKEGETASAALQRVATDYVALDAALGAIGIQFGAVGAGSLESREALIALTGGLDNFVAQAEFFAQNFLTEAERTAATQKQLVAAFSDLGVTAIPKTRDEFKNLVQSLDLTTEGGQKMYAGLIGLQQAFAAVTPQIDAAAVAAKAAADALAQQKEQRSLEIQLLQALGKEEEALAATRADAIAALMTDQAKLTLSQIHAAEDAKKAQELLDKKNADAAQAAAELLELKDRQQKETRDLDIRLLEALGDEEGALAAKRQDALAALMTDAARLTLTQIYAAEDAAAAAKKLEEAAKAAKDQAEKVRAALVAGAETALSNLTASVNAEKSAISDASKQQADLIRESADVAIKSAQDSLDAAKDQESAIRSVFSDLQSALKTTGIEAEGALLARRQAAQIALRSALANPAGLAANTSVSDALKTITGSDQRLFGTFEEYAREQAQTNNTIASLLDVAGVQVDSAELTVKRLGENIDTIKLTSEKQIAQLQINAQAQIDKLDQELAAANAQLDVLKGINGGIFQLAQAQQAFAAAIADLIANRDEKAEAEKSETANLLAASAEQATSLMTRVTDTAQNNAALLAEVQRLNSLTETQQATLDRIAEATGITGDVLDRAQKGQPIATTSEAS